MPVPWFLHPCSCPAEGKPVDGVLCWPDEREFDQGEDGPFLVSQTPDLIRPPPPAYTSARFTRSFGIHSPCCRGLCLLSAFDGNNLLWVTALLVLIPAVGFVVLVGPPLVEEFGPMPLAVMITMMALCILFLVLTWLVEPGIIPYVEVDDTTVPSKPVKLIFVVLNGQYYLRQSFRAQNSRLTGSCIEHFDHHCPYVGNSIGVRNYRYFILFITSVVITCAYASAASTALVYARIHHDKESIGTALMNSAGAAVLGGYAALMGISVATLLGYHIRLICLGMTTYDDLKGILSGNRRPDDIRCLRFCAGIFCGPHYPSRVAGLREPERAIDPEDQVTALNESLLFSPSTPVVARNTPRPTPLDINARQLSRSTPQIGRDQTSG